MEDKQTEADEVIIEERIVSEWELLDPQTQPLKPGPPEPVDEEEDPQEPDGVIDLGS